MADLGIEELTTADLDEIRDLLESGMHDEAIDKLLSLARKFGSEKLSNEVFSQVGVLTRDLHEAIKNFAEDERLRVIANVDMPKASERLSSIINMTNTAASKTLDAVDACEPMVKSLQSSVDQLLPAWSALMHGRIDRDNFVALCKNVDTLINDTQKKAEKLCVQLNDILMAQDYQDLTGQMIQKVITLVSEVEDKLLKFLKNFSEEDLAIMQGSKAESAIQPQGPALESEKQTENVAANQDEVDDLLASLGF
ncbi:MAG: protein phosphatase CheZ [Succinivibrio sp.]